MPDWTLRPAGAEDLAFLQRLYASTRLGELAGLGWNDAQLQAFLAMQFEAQDRHYRHQFPAARHEVIEVEGECAGRLYTDRSGSTIHLVDIALLPGQRGGGLGTAILHSVLAEAMATTRAVSLHVAVDNPARRLYERLGFVAGELHGLHLQMSWQPPTSRPPQSHTTSRHQELTHEHST